MNKKDKILQNIEVKNTSTHFTKNVMQDIYSLEIAKENSLKKTLKENSLLSTSADFTNIVLNSIEKQQTIYKPVEIFSTFQKAAICIIAIAITTISILSANGNQLQLLDFSQFEAFFSFNIPHIPQIHIPDIPISPIASISLLSFTILLFIDYSIKKLKFE